MNRVLFLLATATLVVAVFYCQPHKEFRGEKLETGYWALRKGERLAREKCSTCHLAPEPGELEQYTWEYMLAYMGLYFGIGSENRLAFDEGFLNHYRLRTALLTHQKTVGIAGSLAREEFYAIRNYYLAKSNTSPPALLPEFPVASFFESNDLKKSTVAAVSLLKYQEGKLYIGDAANPALEIHDLISGIRERMPADSPPVSVRFDERGPYVTLIGDLLGTAPAVRSAALTRIEGKRLRLLAGQLTRTAGVLLTDIDSDGCIDLLNPGFGAPLSGGIYLIAGFCRKAISEQVLLQRDGAVAVEPFSLFGKPGYLLAFANAREGLTFLAFENGKPEFRDLLQLPATTGLTAMKLADFSGDGKLEILLTGGDNADAGPYNSIKPAMGVRILEASSGVVEEKYFFHYPGAFNVAVGDINRDGRQDFVVVSYFSDLRKAEPDDALLFLNEGEYQFRILRLPATGRFSTVEIADLNHDGWPDILLGRAELPYEQRIGVEIQKREFPARRSAILLLRNTGRMQ